MDNPPIASNIRKLREARHWTQEELAVVAGVDVRTIQRAESGQPLRIDTMKAIAAGFDTTIELISVSEEQIQLAIKEFEKNYKIVYIQPVNRGAELSRFLTGTEGLQFRTIGEFSEDQLDPIAEFESELQDWLLIGSDLSPLHRREAEKSLDRLFLRFQSVKVSVSAGEEALSLKSAGGGAFGMHVLHIAVVAGDVPLHALVREKNQPVSFSFA
ncbi:MAG: helix-turn-helix transcriptional regulator [Acidobacteria bacterium]|nr:helix-turn-helix transcriptional regulator [Acidobacteriota bacterium]